MNEWGWFFVLAAGFAAAWLLQSFRLRGRSHSSEQEREETMRAHAKLEVRSEELEKSVFEAKEHASKLQEENTALHSKLAGGGERILFLNSRIEEQKKELVEIHKKLSSEFEALANRVLDSNSDKFVARNKESLDKLLIPLAEKITNFRERVEKTHEQGVKDRATLSEQLKTLGDLNRRMSEEAHGLTTALRGQSKTQGNWGELILETVLEKSGLVSGQEYETQVSLQNEEGKRYQPDVLINLPEGKHLVIDAKASLVAYERCVNAEDEDKSERFLKEHIQSMKAHVNELSKKRYDTLYGIESPDFTLMFVPVEPAFSLAMQNDDTLFDHAFRQNVIMVTPSTLLATLRTVSSIWRQEKQTRNALDIAQRSGALYDKFVGFFEDMKRIGSSIQKSGEIYDAAMSKLKTGRGNLVNQVESLKKLGARAQKALPDEAVESSGQDKSFDG